jgi:DNA-binding transcriptional LysR family regulator
MSQSIVRRYLRHGMLPQLAVFESAARLGGFTRAGEELHMAQPTVSTQLRKLSDTLGVQLFEQVGRKVHLTPAGNVVLQGCRDLFAAFEHMDTALGALRKLETGRLQLAVGTAAAHFAPHLLAQFVEKHPQLEVSLQVHNREALIRRLEGNQDDLYIFANPPQGEVVCQPLAGNAMAVVARKDHAMARRRRVPLAQLAQEPFLLREPGSGTRQFAVEMFQRHGLAPRVRMELSGNEAIKQAVLAGLGVSILPQCTLEAEGADRFAVLDIEDMPLERPWQLVYPVGKQVPPPARAFLDFARAGRAA